MRTISWLLYFLQTGMLYPVHIVSNGPNASILVFNGSMPGFLNRILSSFPLCFSYFSSNFPQHLYLRSFRATQIWLAPTPMSTMLCSYLSLSEVIGVLLLEIFSLRTACILCFLKSRGWLLIFLRNSLFSFWFVLINWFALILKFSVVISWLSLFWLPLLLLLLIILVLVLAVDLFLIVEL